MYPGLVSMVQIMLVEMLPNVLARPILALHGVSVCVQVANLAHVVPTQVQGAFTIPNHHHPAFLIGPLGQLVT